MIFSAAEYYYFSAGLKKGNNSMPNQDWIPTTIAYTKVRLKTGARAIRDNNIGLNIIIPPFLLLKID